MKYCLLSLFLLLLTACTGDFAEVNEDPNRIATISPGTLINPILYDLATHNAGRSHAITFDLMQVTVPFPSVSGGLHRYDVSPNIGNSSWYWYYRLANNVKEMRMAAVEAEDPNYEAIALTLNALIYANLTDLFGPVPMEEASRGEEGNLYPRFNSQEEVYATILSDLERANTLYDADLGMVYAPDILFQNDVEKWQKFTNSLHLRLLLRVSNRPDFDSWETLTTMVGNPDLYPVMMATDESAVLQVTGVTPNVSPWGRPQDFRLNTKMTSFFIDNLNALEDPRRPVIATMAKDSANQNIGYRGIPSAYDGPESQFTYNASTLTIEQVENPMQIFLLTYAEVELIKAELAQRGYTDGAEAHYRAGVTAAAEQLGATIAADYFENPLAAYDGSLDRILLQKYYALYFVDYQQWLEYRRTGLPELPTTPATLNDGNMPARFFYPQDVRINNNANYEDALGLLGGLDDINTKVWWDTID
ncbi:SusD-like starch-binding protein associating with outer membrane [Neolewinella xylanilytica]|uniref:SusD-like starch-binding protein associating with outer membrane n=1 Tax=Neolewinella xylanilytica TaxID=1514080 RepID=A0A2S6I8P3_9BACT|nr:SusD/RagB family nutrient-binding outer membrane lipoprotein [Neolewinella xylanilytica]PPK87849.1 SusD-like starch-binding protein associating with outer membrane [Neolewinella xylanilytica]